jgi:hypothetical protein
MYIAIGKRVAAVTPVGRVTAHADGGPPYRNRKLLPGLRPPWEQELPVWELRVGEWRVFYDVDVAQCIVTVRAIRHKPPHATTEEIL